MFLLDEVVILASISTVNCTWRVARVRGCSFRHTNFNRPNTRPASNVQDILTALVYRSTEEFTVVGECVYSVLKVWSRVNLKLVQCT